MDPALETDLINRFRFHPAGTPEREVAHAGVRSMFLYVARELAENVPPGRELSLALTKVEEAMFWANAGIARAPE